MAERESVNVLNECIQLQLKKSADYQNPNSNIKQAMHYRRGISSIHDMIAQKLLRAQSLIEPLENGEGHEPNFESLEDTYKDLINYASFAVSYIRGKMEGQDSNRDMFNRQIYNGVKPGEPVDFDLIPLAVKTEEHTLDYEFEPIAYDSDGSSSGQVVSEEIEADGFITVIPSLLKIPNEDLKEIKLNPDKNAAPEERIQAAYFREVAPKGRVNHPGKPAIIKSVRQEYLETGFNTPKDVGDRIDDDFKEHIDRNYP